jgi:hypothetical protein
MRKKFSGGRLVSLAALALRCKTITDDLLLSRSARATHCETLRNCSGEQKFLS